MNEHPEFLSEGEFIDSDRNMTDRSGALDINLNDNHRDLSFEEENNGFEDEGHGDNDLGDFDDGDMEMDSARQAEMLEATDFI